MTSNDLYTRFRDHGDQDALRALIQRHHAGLIERMSDWGVNPATAEDIAQRVYRQLVIHAHTFDPATSDVVGWMNWLADRRARPIAPAR